MLTLQEPQDPKKKIEDSKTAIYREQALILKRAKDEKRKGNTQSDQNRPYTDGEKTYFSLREKYHAEFTSLLDKQQQLGKAVNKAIIAQDEEHSNAALMKAAAQATAEEVSIAYSALTQKLVGDPAVATLAGNTGSGAESVALGVMEKFKDLNPNQFGIFEGKDIELREQFRAEADAKLGNTPSATPVDLSADAQATKPEKLKEEKKETVDEVLARTDQALRKNLEGFKLDFQRDIGTDPVELYDAAKPLGLEIGKKFYPDFLALTEKSKAFDASVKAYTDAIAVNAPDQSLLEAAAKAKAFELISADKDLQTKIEKDPLVAELSATLTDKVKGTVAERWMQPDYIADSAKAIYQNVAMQQNVKDEGKVPEERTRHFTKGSFGFERPRFLDEAREKYKQQIEKNGVNADSSPKTPGQTPAEPAKPEQGKGNDR